MTKFNPIGEIDFSFSKIPQKNKSYWNWTSISVATTFVTVFMSLLIYSNHHIKPSASNQSYPADTLEKKYQDNPIQLADKNMLESIFVYDNTPSFDKDKTIQSFQENIRKNDLLHAPFDNNKAFNVTSSILSIDSSDKTSLINFNSQHDYLDLVVEKIYSQNNKSYFEQQLVTVELDNHKILSMKSHGLID